MEKLIDILERERTFVFLQGEIDHLHHMMELPPPRPYYKLLDHCQKVLFDQNPADIFIWMPNLIRGITDFSIKNRKFPQQNLETKMAVMQANYLAFQGDFNGALQILENLQYPVQMVGHEVYEKTDSTTWACTDPAYARNVAEQMEVDKYKPDRLLIVGHGSYRAGLMLASLLDISPHSVRCSLDKMEDRGVRVPAYEKKKMIEAFFGRDLLIFDEDTYSGETMDEMISFAESLHPKDIKTASSVSLQGHLEAGYTTDYVAKFGPVN